MLSLTGDDGNAIIDECGDMDDGANIDDMMVQLMDEDDVGDAATSMGVMCSSLGTKSGSGGDVLAASLEAPLNGISSSSSCSTSGGESVLDALFVHLLSALSHLDGVHVYAIANLLLEPVTLAVGENNQMSYRLPLDFSSKYWCCIVYL